MRLALEEAAAALGSTSPNPAVGAVVVREGRVVGRGRTQPPGGAHAEIVALRQAGDLARGAEAYVTLEPCAHHGRTPPCTDALIAAGVAAVHYAIDDPDERVAGRGAEALRTAGVRVEAGDGAAESARLLEGYLHHRQTGRPFVIAKYAASIDGRIAAASGDARWVSGDEAREWAHGLRTRVDAIVVGSGTVIADDPTLTARPNGETCVRQPLRVVLDARGRASPSARVFGTDARTLLATTAASAAAWRDAIAGRGVEVAVLPPAGRGEGAAPRGDPAPSGGIDLEALLVLLAERGVVTLLAEGGGTLLGALADLRRIDRIYAVIAPVVIGAASAPAPIAGRGAQVMRDAARLDDLTVERLGRDTLIGGVPVWPDVSAGSGGGGR